MEENEIYVAAEFESTLSCSSSYNLKSQQFLKKIG